MDYPGGPKKVTRIFTLKRQEGWREGQKEGDTTVKAEVRVMQGHNPSIAGSSSHWKSQGNAPAPHIALPSPRTPRSQTCAHPPSWWPFVTAATGDSGATSSGPFSSLSRRCPVSSSQGVPGPQGPFCVLTVCLSLQTVTAVRAGNLCLVRCCVSSDRTHM